MFVYILSGNQRCILPREPAGTHSCGAVIAGYVSTTGVHVLCVPNKAVTRHFWTKTVCEEEGESKLNQK